jgi:hypothetical protein
MRFNKIFACAEFSTERNTHVGLESSQEFGNMSLPENHLKNRSKWFEEPIDVVLEFLGWR